MYTNPKEYYEGQLLYYEGSTIPKLKLIVEIWYLYSNAAAIRVVGSSNIKTFEVPLSELYEKRLTSPSKCAVIHTK